MRERERGAIVSREKKRGENINGEERYEGESRYETGEGEFAERG